MSLPIGTVVLWDNDVIPVGWHLCDGTNGTPDLRGKFVMGAADSLDLLETGGVETHNHIAADTSIVAKHNHSVAFSTGAAGGDDEETDSGGGVSSVRLSHTHYVSGNTQDNADHKHTIGNSGSSSNLPAHIKLYFIMKTE